MSNGFIDSATLTEANVSLNLSFSDALQRDNPLWYTDLATVTKSNGAITKYPFLGGMTGLREWVDERVYDNFSRYAYSLVNKTFEKSIEVPVNDMEDDQLNGYAKLAEELGYQAKLWPNVQVAAALKAGASTLGFDAVNFFSASHPVDLNDATNGTYANLFTSTALTAPNLDSVVSAMSLIRARNGDPAGFGTSGKILLVVPPQLRNTARTIVAAPFLAGGATNTMQGMADVLVIPELGMGGGANATNWFVADVGHVIKPLLWQVRQEPVMTSLVSLNDPSVFEKDVYRWGIKARGAAGFTIPWLMAKCTA